MTENGTNAGKKRWAWLAAILSTLMPGMGQVYCGRLTRGLLFGLLYGVAVPVVLGTLAYFGPTSTIFFGFLMIVATFGIVIGAAVDSYRLARRTRPDYTVKGYNRPAIYVLLGLMIQGSCLGYTLHVRSSLFEAFRVVAGSMYPTIAPEDRILADKRAYKIQAPRAGDIVLFHPPTKEWRMHWIKRVIAVAGETVEIKGGTIYVNDRELPQRRIGAGKAALHRGPSPAQTLEGEILAETNGGTTYEVFVSAPLEDFARITVPEHHCFVMGDNRNASMDSREFGVVSLGSITARADYLYWPVDTWARFGRLDRTAASASGF